MSILRMSDDDRNRYKAKPSVLDALRSPRLLTKEVLADLSWR